jgi:thiamine biosynthesis lipoprotein
MALAQVAPKPMEVLASPSQDFALASETQKHMGTDFTVQFYYLKGKQNPQPAMAAAFAKIAALDKMMSDYDPESELSKLGASSPHQQPVAVSPDLYDILVEAEPVSSVTDGAFDVTVGPITRLWRQARRQKKLPDADKLKEALAAVDWKSVQTSMMRADKKDAAFVVLKKAKMRLDLGGIAQGYAADKAFEIFQASAFSRALVNASGDIRVGDAPPGKPGWKIGLTGLNPKGEPPTRFVVLANAAISTSGDAFQFVEVEGKRYSHIVDPKTGMGLTTPMSVTVIAPDCTTADAFASALCVMGLEGTKKKEQMLREKGLSALFVVQTGEGVKTEALFGFEKFYEASASP